MQDKVTFKKFELRDFPFFQREYKNDTGDITTHRRSLLKNTVEALAAAVPYWSICWSIPQESSNPALELIAYRSLLLILLWRLYEGSYQITR